MKIDFSFRLFFVVTLQGMLLAHAVSEPYAEKDFTSIRAVLKSQMTGGWLPSIENIASLEQALPERFKIAAEEYVHNRKLHAGCDEQAPSLDMYGRQYIGEPNTLPKSDGVDQEGRKWIRVFGFCAAYAQFFFGEKSPEYFYSNEGRVPDDGSSSCFFGAYFDPNSRKFISYEIQQSNLMCRHKNILKETEGNKK